VAHEYGVRLATIAFATALLQGVIEGGSVTNTVQSGLLALAIFYGLGWLTGEVTRRAVEESVVAKVLASTPQGKASGS
jgi:hypothetical protein